VPRLQGSATRWGAVPSAKSSASNIASDARCSSPQERHTPRSSRGAQNALPTWLQDVGVDHGRGTIVVPEQLLNGADVSAALEQVSGKRMAKGAGADGLRQTSTADGHLDGFIVTLFTVQRGELFCREKSLPDKLLCRMRIFVL
jgi:hypothetical protein